MEWFSRLATTAMELLNEGSPIALGALFAITTLTELGVPFPLVQDTVLIYVGYEPTGRLTLMSPLVIGSMIAGRMLGATIVYLLCRFLGGRFIGWIGRRSPSLQARVESLGDKLGRRTAIAVTVARLTPGLLSPSTIAAGVFKVNHLQFCLGIALSSLVMDGAYVLSGIGLRAGFNLLGLSPSPIMFSGGIAAIIGLSTLGAWLLGRRRRQPAAYSREA